MLNYEYYLGLTGGEKVTVTLTILFYVSAYILIILAEPFQRDADEPGNDEVSDPRKEEDSDMEDYDDYVGETDDSEDKEDVNDPQRKSTYNMI